MLTWWLLVALCAAGAAACPQHCSCFTNSDGYNSANCSTLALGAVQPSNLEHLRFQPHEPGYPTKLAPRAFLAFKRVKFLWVVNCSVLNLPNEVFQGLDFVIKMDFSYNKIRHLNGGVFKSLGSLHTLLLRGNPLLLTPWDVIVSDSLQELDLGHCGLRTIPQGTFISVPRLSRLYLDGNEIHTFTFNMIPAGLRYLNLAHNRIVTVPTDVLTTMSYLRKLDLSKNPIHCNCNLVIMQDWFSGQGIIFENGVTCSEPAQYAGQHLSNINENELCTLEEVKRQRRINDIESYRDSKSHRTHNMIHDPDLQSDQPGGELYSEVLFDNEGTRGLGTHMEMSKHYPLPSDLSDENNKVAGSKHELTHAHSVLPTHYEPVKKVLKEDILGELSISSNPGTSDEISNEDLSIVNHASSLKTLTAESLTKMDHNNHITNMALNVTSHPSNDSTHLIDLGATDSPENEMADEGYSPLYTSTPQSHKEYTELEKEHALLPNQAMSDGLSFYMPPNTSVLESLMADEGYSPASHMNNSELEDVGSGDDEWEAHSVSQTPLPDKNESATQASFNFQTSHVDSSDYTYDAQHDYSAEIDTTTESMRVTDTDEGSGSSELDLGSTSLPPYINEDNETSTEYYLTIENTTDIKVTSESSTEIYASSSSDYTTLPATTYSSSENIITSEKTEESTSELSTEETTVAIIYSSSETIPSSSESSTSSSEPVITTELPLSSSPEPAVVITTTELPSSSTEFFVSSSSEGPIIPFIDPDLSITTEEHSEIAKDTTPVPEITHAAESTTVLTVNEVEIISRTNKQDQKEHIMIEPTQAEREEGRTEAAQPTLNYIIAGLIVVLIVIIITAVICKKVFRTGPCTSKKKIRLPQDTEAHLATEMQDMLLPKPPENGVKIIPQNGTQNGKEVKEEEIPVLQKDWDEKPEPIETVTARMSVIAGPQTPVFIHKTLA